MKRRMGLVFFLVFAFNAAAWAKWKPEEQEYLDNQFKTLQEQLQVLEKQVATLDAQLDQLKQNQAQFQQVLTLQQRKLEDLDQLVTSLRIGNEEHFANLKTSVADLREGQEKGFKELSTRMAPEPAPQPAAPAAPAAAATTPATTPTLSPDTKGYVTRVRGSVVTIDIGSSQGIQSGTRLGLYKATDLNTRVGEVEVTEAEASSSRARIISHKRGVTPASGDQVRPE
jgi:uncharacterized phage infection (PIP) family protein YhgE